jgi:hypothetical protein
MSRIFISYSHRDDDFVLKLVSDLQTDHDVAVDYKSIVPDIPLMQQISAHIGLSEVFVVVISDYSAQSPWVTVEIARAFSNSLYRRCQILPIVLGDAAPDGFLADKPYIRFRTQGREPFYSSALREFRNMIRRNPIVSGNLVLQFFSTWGNIEVVPEGTFGLRVNSRGPMLGASGLAYDGPLHVTGFTTLTLTISGSSTSKFTGWVPRWRPKMLKIELDGQPLPALDSALRAADDIGYIKPKDGTVDYQLPSSILQRGFVGKFEIVIGNGKIHDFVLHAKFS